MKIPPDSEFAGQLLGTLKSVLGALRECRYQSLASDIAHSCVVPKASYSPWLDDPAFNQVFEVVSGSTLVDRYRMHELWQLAGQLCMPDRPGDVLEVGTWRGGSGCLLARRCQELGSSATIFMCDTFKGVVKTGGNDTAYKGGEHFDATRDDVMALAAKLALTNIEILQGIFPEDTGSRLTQRQFALCHIDVDAYLSAKDVADWVWGRLVVGGAIVFDDYGFWGCEGVTRFVNEAMRRPDRLLMHNLNGHAVVVKTAHS